MEAFGLSDLAAFYFAGLSRIFLLRLRWLQRSGVSMKLTSLNTYFSSSMCWHCSGMRAYRTNFKVWKRRRSTNQRRDLDVWEWVQWERQSSFLVWNPGLGGVGNGNRRDSRGLGRADVMGRVVWRWLYKLSKGRYWRGRTGSPSGLWRPLRSWVRGNLPKVSWWDADSLESQ